MHQDLLAALASPLLFSREAGSYGFGRFPERRENILLIVVLFQLLGAYAVHQQPSVALLGLLSVHALLVQHLQEPLAGAGSADKTGALDY